MALDARLLRGSASSETLGPALADVTALVEELVPECRCAVWIPDRDGRRLWIEAAPGLPAAFAAAIDGVAIAPDSPSCGAAACLGEPVVAADLATDPAWKPHRDLALTNGVRACWALPIPATEGMGGGVLGVVALYLPEPSAPSAHRLQAVQAAVRLAARAIEPACGPSSASVDDIIERDRTTLEQLRESDERHRLITLATNEATWDFDVASGRVRISESYDAAFGRPPDARTALAWWTERIHPDDRERVVASMRAVLDGSDSQWIHEYRFQRADGLWADVLDRGYVARNADGSARRVVGAVQDVTSRRRAEARVQQSEERYRLALLATEDAIWDVDLRSGEVHRSERYAQAYGLPDEGEDGWQWWVDRIHPEDRVRADRSLRAALAGTDAQWRCTYRFRRPDGAWATIEDSGTIARDATGAATRVVGAMRDVTERNHTREERERLWNLSMDPLGVGGFDGYLKQVNPSWTRLLGWSEAELTSRPWEDFIHPDDRSASEEILPRLAGGEPVVGFENRYLCKDGTSRWLAWTAFPLPEERMIFCVGRDVTEQKALEEQLRQSQRMEAIGQLAGGVAHDFNNLLTVINGFSEMLIDETGDADPRHEPACAIREAGERAAGLTAQLLAFGRRAIVEPAVLDLNVVVESSARMLRRLIGEDVELVSRLGPAIGHVYVDRGQIEQVLMNLAVNARDAMPLGGHLLLATSEVEIAADAGRDRDLGPGRYVRLAVSDSGAGMTEEVRRRALEPFFTTKAAGKGTGLGLSTVYGIVRQAGGAVEIDSAPECGTTVSILLPAREPASQQAKPAVAQSPRPGSETVLIAEDEDGVRSLARLALERAGYTVLEAGSGADALRTAQSWPGPIHILFTDVVMTDTGGRALVDAIRASRPSIRVLYTTGYTDDAVLRRGVEVEGRALLQKPFTPAALASAVRRVLDDSES